MNFGPGDPMLAHKQEEYVPLEQLRGCEPAARVVAGRRTMTDVDPIGAQEKFKGPVVMRRGQVDGTTTDQRLLDSRGPTDWVHTDPWRVLRIQAEFVEGFGALAELRAGDRLLRLRTHQAATTRSTRSVRRSAASWPMPASR